MISEDEYWKKFIAAQRGEVPKHKVKPVPRVECSSMAELIAVIRDKEVANALLGEAKQEIEKLRFEKTCLEEENAELSRDAAQWRKLREMLMKEMGLYDAD